MWLDWLAVLRQCAHGSVADARLREGCAPVAISLACGTAWGFRISFLAQIWDTAGQERYRSLAPMYYRGAAAAVVVFDVTNKETFEGAKTWVTELKRRGDSGVVIALAGNKCDLPTRSVDSEEAGEYAKSQGILYMEVSAKTNKNIKELFVSIANALPRNTAADKSDLVDMMATDDKKKKGCC